MSVSKDKLGKILLFVLLKMFACLFLKIFCAWVFGPYLCLGITYMFAWGPQKPEKGTGSPELVLKTSCEPPCGC